MPVRLSRSVEIHLVIIARAEDDGPAAEAARNQLLSAHEGAIRGVAIMISNSVGRIDLLTELIQEGRIAFNGAIDHFNPDSRAEEGDGARQNARLWAYSRKHVIGAMLNFIGKMRDGGIIGLGRQLDLLRRVRRVHDEIMRQSDLKPTPAEIAGRLQVSVQSVEQALTLIGIAGSAILPLMPPSLEDDEAYRVEIPAAGAPFEEQLAWKERFQELLRALDHLRSPRYIGSYGQACDFFVLRYFKEMEVGRIAELKGIDRVTVWRGMEQKLKPALENLLTHLSDEAMTLHHLREVDGAARAHVEMHLAVTVAGDPYCRYCHRRSKTLQSLIPLHLKGLDVEQVESLFQEEKRLVRELFLRLDEILPHLRDEELASEELESPDGRQRDYVSLHLRHCQSCTGRRRLLGLVIPFILGSLLLWRVWLSVSHEPACVEDVSVEAAAALIGAARSGLSFPRCREGGLDASRK